MENIIDTRGFSCPQPVIMVLAEINKIGKGSITVLVDTDTAKENVIRAAVNKDWIVARIDKEGDDYRIGLSKA